MELAVLSLETVFVMVSFFSVFNRAINAARSPAWIYRSSAGSAINSLLEE